MIEKGISYGDGRPEVNKLLVKLCRLTTIILQFFIVFRLKFE